MSVKRVLGFICMTAAALILSAGVMFAADVHVFYVTPKGVTAVAAPAGSNMTWM